MKMCEKDSCGQKTGHHFTLLAAQRQESTGRTYGTQSDKKQLAPGTFEGVAIFAEWAPATELFHRRYRALGYI